MRKGKLTKSNSEQNYKLLQDCINNKLTQKNCAILLGLSERQIRRKCNKLRSNNSISALAHKSRGRCPINRIPDKLRKSLIQCCNTVFSGYGPTLVSEEFELMHGTKLAVETTRQIMIEGGVWTAKNKDIKRIHNMRERVSCYGEMVQADGTEYDWLGDGNKYIMLVFIDDATSSLLHAVLVKSESRSSYMQAMNDYMQKHGRPMCLYTDKHGVFRVNMPSATEDAQTQFARAMESLGIRMIQAHSAQAKGRVERANQTLQDRVPKKLKLLGITNLEAANEYLANKYPAEYNRKFAVVPSSPINMHRPLKSTHNLEQILALHDKRLISKNHTFQYDNQVVQIMDETTNLHKKEANIIAKNDEITHVLVANKAVKFKVLKIRAKQSEAACAKMILLAVSSARESILAANAQTPFERILAVGW